ncbi:molybdenum cofactor synthesis domain-containing protein [Hydrogenoanaerobacterium saccharovorans]|uniref:Molybdenum cofactor synthesis domain-containing protein n=1 Tax=Hydrogenoanaerobacterium saccharovorans TaxID=474960 RepID=A0A1H7YZL3_9FIRM|nr:MogA/MoaB family molybdenum cofactor biosynthesis protein [Hydrogenoanaerobacterium saccharovorans]RPF48915.1 molybdenum cofactor synthesis domain-containing protein [Hydrogenoanaerobacterium saccharovorans]SEM51435.1 molybdenum cofactor synthesis domain-containing protein [Hydrogenoanaerobacterium saccharovorans]
MFRVAIITLSDKGYAGEREDKSGEVIREVVTKNGYEAVSYTLLPDDRTMLANELRRLCDNDLADLILTTGGTGFSPRDITPEATLDVAQKLVPGIPEAMRYSSLQITKRAMLSRSVAAIREKALIVNLPGSPNAVRENLEYIIAELHHGLEILKGKTDECARI